MIERPKVILFAALLVCAVLSLFADRISPYYYDIIIGIGINIVLAASLNSRTLHGNFSSWACGFMAVGAYSRPG
jgi:branched-chain amino acid transport system permease protein